MTIRIKAREFAKDVKSSMDDNSLMAKYRLNPDQLQRIFEQMVDMDLLSEEHIKVRAMLSESQIARAFLEYEEDRSPIV